MSSNPSLESDTCVDVKDSGSRFKLGFCKLNSMLNITSIFFDIMVTLALTTSRAAGTRVRGPGPELTVPGAGTLERH